MQDVAAHSDSTELDYAQRVHESFQRQGLMHHLGAELIEVDRGLVKIRMRYAAYTLFPEGSSVLTVEFKINLVAPAQGDFLEGVGKVVRSGRTLTICQLEVFAIKGDERMLVALGQQTLMCMHGKPDSAA